MCAYVGEEETQGRGKGWPDSHLHTSQGRGIIVGWCLGWSKHTYTRTEICVGIFTGSFSLLHQILHSCGNYIMSFLIQIWQISLPQLLILWVSLSCMYMHSKLKGNSIPGSLSQISSCEHYLSSTHLHLNCTCTHQVLPHDLYFNGPSWFLI